MVLFSPEEIRKGNLVCQSHTQKTSWSAALILNTLSRVTELKEITESFSCEFWHDSQQTFPHLNSQERLIIKAGSTVGPRARGVSWARWLSPAAFLLHPSPPHPPHPSSPLQPQPPMPASCVLVQPNRNLAGSCGPPAPPSLRLCSCSPLAALSVSNGPSRSQIPLPLLWLHQPRVLASSRSCMGTVSLPSFP